MSQRGLVLFVVLFVAILIVALTVRVDRPARTMPPAMGKTAAAGRAPTATSWPTELLSLERQRLRDMLPAGPSPRYPFAPPVIPTGPIITVTPWATFTGHTPIFHDTPTP